ncbi:PAS domain-containing protein [Kordiimonas lacus]|uniref:PAS domain-containing protein n=1 Tax=Kordiimonas lacus TaxID=637679 RepID=A0A1G7B7Q0_9PROT|nr:PAS domain-containing protein [Kordiimonas lacus]SDE22336.1 PAS domain-containing protein [Kordiimonas lacus]
MTIPTFSPELPDFAENPGVRGFLAAWDRWRGDSLLPKRDDIRLMDVPELMRGAMLLDAVSMGEFVFRYAGTLYEDMYGFDFTGKNYLDLTDEGLKPIRSKRLWGIVSQPAAAVWTTPSVESVDFTGVSVPILPNDPSHPRKIMQIVMLTREISEVSYKVRAQRREKIYFSDHFRYIDIGAGLPDTSVES